MTTYLEFEKPLAEIEGKAEELRAMARANAEMDVEKEAAALDRKAAQLLKDLYKDLSPWRKAQVARHPDRPRFDRPTRWSLGLLSAASFVVPVANLLAPILSAAMAVHLLHLRDGNL